MTDPRPQKSHDELIELTERYLQRDITDAQLASLNRQLASDTNLRRLFVDLCTDAHQLGRAFSQRDHQQDLARRLAALTDAETLKPGDARVPGPSPTPVSKVGAPIYRKGFEPQPARIRPHHYALAAVLLAACGVAIYLLAFNTPTDPKPDPSQPGPPVATLIQNTGNLTTPHGYPAEGDDYGRGEYALSTGTAEFMLTNAVNVKLRGETRLVMHNPMNVSLDRGSAKFVCPPDANGFAVHLPSGARVVDLGTAFGLSLTRDGEAELRVTEGSVRIEFDPKDPKTHHVVTAGTRAVVGLASRSMQLDDIGVSINVNFSKDETQRELIGPASGREESWNQLSEISATRLLDRDGRETSVGFTSDGANWGGPSRIGSPSLLVLGEAMSTFEWRAEKTWQKLTITGLEPGTRYDVYLASGNTYHRQRSQGEWTSVNPCSGESVATTDNTQRVNADTWERGNNYVLFKDVEVDENGELRFTGKLRRDNTYDTRLPLNGFQLRPASDSKYDDTNEPPARADDLSTPESPPNNSTGNPPIRPNPKETP